jgi:putative component of membrane protein insertase Oxa1/YidC/SpoIIIJ protein YidD
MNPLKYLLIGLIAFYQSYLVGDNPSVECNFRPSCSEYTKRALRKHGVLRGLQLGWDRLRRCTNPDQIDKISDPVP